jgi:hypothetical protein
VYARRVGLCEFGEPSALEFGRPRVLDKVFDLAEFVRVERVHLARRYEVLDFNDAPGEYDAAVFAYHHTAGLAHGHT